MSLGTILGIKLSSVDENGALGCDEFLNVARVVDKLVVDEGRTNCGRAHLEGRYLLAGINMDSSVDSIKIDLSLT